MANEVKEVKEGRKAEVEYEVDGQHIRLTPNIVKQYIVGNSKVDITMQEFKFFSELCQARKLNPFLKEAYLIKYGTDPAQIVVGKDAILKRAIRNENFDGREQGIIVQKENGEIEQRIGTFKLANEKLVGGWARVYRKDISHPTEITVSFDEVAQRKRTGELNSNWANKGATMVEKVALVRALRETFIEDLGGMIDADETWDLAKDISKTNEQKQQKEQSEQSIDKEDVIEAEYAEVKDENNIELLSIEYTQLRSNMQREGIDFRDELDTKILQTANVGTQDLQMLDASSLKRLNDVYKELLKTGGVI